MADWTNYVAYKGDYIAIHAPVNHAITIGEDTVVLVSIEIPLSLGWKGTIGAYFMDQDFNATHNIYDDKNAWAQLESSVGKVLGLPGLKLGRGRDFFEPLNGEGVGIRPVMPMSVISGMIKNYVKAAGKDRVLKMILRAIKDGVDVSDLVDSIKQQGGDSWPEMASIEKSINAGKNLEETDVNESISDKPSVNAEIEKLLRGLDPSEQTRTLDALEALKNAGDAGLSPTEWADKVRMLHPDGDFSMKDLLKSVVTKFKCCVQRAGDKLYVWNDDERDLGDVPPEVAGAIRGQVQLASTSMEIMRRLGEFTLPQLATEIHTRTGLPLSAASEFADHLINQFHGGMVTPIGDGKFKVNVEPKKTADDHMDDLRNILKNAGLNPGDN